MDLSGIDKLMEVLTKAAGRVGGSPPVMEGGKRGVWRTIRGYRMFLELNGDSLGSVLVGPPAFKGGSLDDVGTDVWAALTPEATKRKFSSVDAGPGGVERLKSAVSESLGAKDTRRSHLETVNTVEQLVPIARSAGFRDEDIVASLQGKNTKAPAVPNRLTRNAAPNIEREPAKAPPDKQFRSVVDAFNAPAAEGRDTRIKGLAAQILNAAKREPNETKKAQLEAIGYALASGATTVSHARERVTDIEQNDGRNTPRVQQKDVDSLHDRVELQDFLDAHEKKIEQIAEAKAREAAGDSERARDLAMLDMLEELEARVHVAEVKTELVKIREAIDSKRMTRQMGLRRIVQLLRLLLAVIPGL
jgi:hypothetical protein